MNNKQSDKHEPGNVETVVEGIFDGEGMQGDNGATYPIPANYASKSKLVEGDKLKVTISPDGSFLFKQIQPIERKRVIATVESDPSNRIKVKAGEDTYRVLQASSTYFQLEAGDQVVILVPKDRTSSWAAVENKVTV